MEKESFRAKIKTLRKSKGWSQEQLAQQSALSLRTVPRIEKGVTIPYRDSLLKLSEALGIHIEDMMREEPTEKPDDNDYMVAMHLSFLCFLYHPLLGLVLTFFMGMMKRGKNPCVDQSGKKLMGFQLIWLIVLYMLQLLVTKGRYVQLDLSLPNLLTGLILDFQAIGLLFVFLYLYNAVMIIINAVRSRKGYKNVYIPFLFFMA